jgi:ribosomal protein L12E/L44/L45/RPP1/RPP2
MKVRTVQKRLEDVSSRLEDLRDGVSSALEHDLDDLIEQADALKASLASFADNWEAEAEAAVDLDVNDEDEDDEEDDDGVFGDDE